MTQGSGRWPFPNAWAAPAAGGGTPSDSVVGETAFGASSAAGTSTAYARADHTHGTPAAPAGSTNTIPFVHTSNYTAVASALISSADSTVGWNSDGAPSSGVAAGSSLSLAVWADTTVFDSGTASIYSRIRSSGSGQKIYYDIGATTNWSALPARWVTLSLRWDVGGDALGLYFGCSSTSSLSTPRHTEFPIPYMVKQNFQTMSFPITGTSDIRSIGIFYTTLVSSNDGRSTASSATDWWIDRLERRNMTELEVALESNSSATVWVPQTYTPTGTQGVIDPRPTNVLIDQRSTVRVTSDSEGRKKVRQYLMDGTGVNDVAQSLRFLFASIDDGDTIDFPANGRFWINDLSGIYMWRKSNITINGNGSVIFTTQDRSPGAGADLIARHFVIANCADVVINDLRIWGLITASQNGNAMTSGPGASTSGTAMVLDASGEYAFFAREANSSTGRFMTRLLKAQDTANITEDYMYKFSATLSDSAQVADDVRLTIEDELGNVWATRTLTATAVATEYIIVAAARARNIGLRMTVKVTKATATANTITIASCKAYGTVAYSNDYEFEHGFTISGDGNTATKNVKLNNCWVEGVGGDGYFIGGTVRDIELISCTSRAASRQGCSPLGGLNVTVRNCTIRETGRACVDVESTGDAVTGLALINNRLLNPGNGDAFNVISAANNQTYNRFLIIGNTGYTIASSQDFIRVNCTNSVIAGNIWMLHPDVTQTSFGTGISLGSQSQGNLVYGNWLLGAILNQGVTNYIFGNHVNSANETAFIKDTGERNLWRDVRQWSSSLTTFATNSTDMTWFNFARAFKPRIAGIEPHWAKDMRDSFPAPMHHGAQWFPGGQDMLQEPIVQLRGLSKTTEKANNFWGSVTPANAATTAAVAFTSKGFINPVTFTLAATSVADGNMGNDTYFYRVAGNNFYGPATALTTVSVILAGTQNAVRIRVTRPLQPTSSKYIQAYTIYRSTQNGLSTARYDVLPDIRPMQLGALNHVQHDFYDLSTSLDSNLGDVRSFYLTTPMTSLSTSMELNSTVGLTSSGAAASREFRINDQEIVLSTSMTGSSANFGLASNRGLYKTSAEAYSSRTVVQYYASTLTEYGYKGRYAVTTFAAVAAGAEDRTGWELTSAYEVFFTGSWNAGGFWVTSKASSGFTVNWANATPSGAETLSWFLVR